MKTNIIHFGACALLCASLTSLSGSTIVHQWLFNEPAGTALLNTTDSVGGAVFNRGIAGAATNGEGRLVYATSSNWPDITTPLAANETGIYTIVVTFSNWNVSGFPGTQGPRLMLGFYQDPEVDGFLVGELELQFFNNGVDFYFADSDQEVLLEDAFPVVLEYPLVVTLTVDKNEDTFAISYVLQTSSGPIEDGRTGSLSLGSAGRDIGYFGITSNRDFNRANSVPPHIDSIVVSFGELSSTPDPEPQPDIWAAGELTESGWYYLPWFGFYVYEDQFVYRPGLGWTYTLGADLSSVFIYVFDFQIWTWISENTGGWIWTGEGFGWVYMWHGTTPAVQPWFFLPVFGSPTAWSESLLPLG